MTKFLNIALKDDVPSLVNVDSIIRIYPGLQGGSGKKEACTLVFGFAIDIDYQGLPRIREEYTVEVYLPVKELIRRMREDLLEI